MLNATTECEIAGIGSFCSPIIFGMVLIFSVIVIFIRIGMEPKVKDFLMSKPVARVVLLIGLGFGGVLGISLIASNIGEPLLGIAGAGLVMGYVLIQSNFILAPIVIHGAYNALVINLRNLEVGTLGFFEQLAVSSPINVPEIGLSFPAFVDQIGTESFMQFFLVAGGEEFFKALIIIFAVVAVNKGKFEGKGAIIWFAMIVSVVVWAIYHTIANPSL